MALYNKVDRRLLKERLKSEPFRRKTVSFYRYGYIDKVEDFRDTLYKDLVELQVFGRIYLAYEGINAQVSVPEPRWQSFTDYMQANPFLAPVELKVALQEGESFFKLAVKVKDKIVADGLDDDSYDVTDCGKHLDARQFNEACEKEDTVIVDMRNYYESEVGHFKGAICPDVETFRESLPVIADQLAEKKDKKLLLYCTGGIRCEKASAYFKHQGFQDVNQLKGGIIQYTHEVKDQGLENRFVGKNFVFDGRLGERVTEDILSKCHVCGNACDTHTNCANEECHLLFIQCEQCKDKLQGCCSKRCQHIFNLPLEEQRKIRKASNRKKRNVYGSRVRPKLSHIHDEDWQIDLNLVE